jgi:Raf kinase inhibitor-like YbhB/YbcL family protein
VHAIVSVALALFFALCTAAPAAPDKTVQQTTAMRLTSTAFADGQPIPSKFSYENSSISPALAWSDAPVGTKSFALVCDDPDAPSGDWVHWVIYDIPATITALPEHVPAIETLSNGARQGINDFGRVGYGGPCPPPGKPHRYFFRLYALDACPTLRSLPKKTDLLQAIRGHILAEAQLIGTYQRNR